MGISPTTQVVLSDTLPLGTSFVSATSPYTQTGDTIQWGFPTMDAMTGLQVELVVRVDYASSGSVTNSDYAVWSDQVGPIYGAPVVTLLGSRIFLPMLIRSP